MAEVQRLRLADRIIVREKVADIEEYLQASDVGIFTSDSESFCLGVLEAMCFACPSIATCVGGIPEVIEHQLSGLLVPRAQLHRLGEAVLEVLALPGGKRAELQHAARGRIVSAFAPSVESQTLRKVMQQLGTT